MLRELGFARLHTIGNGVGSVVQPLGMRNMFWIKPSTMLINMSGYSSNVSVILTIPNRVRKLSWRIRTNFTPFVISKTEAAAS